MCITTTINIYIIIIMLFTSLPAMTSTAPMTAPTIAFIDPVDDGDEEPPPKLRPIVGNFYLIKPSSDSPLRYEIGQCKSIEVLEGHPAMRVLYWDPIDPKAGLYSPRRPRTIYRRIAELDMEYTGVIEDKLRDLVKQGRGHRVSKKDQTKVVGYWMERWEDEAPLDSLRHRAT